MKRPILFVFIIFITLGHLYAEQAILEWINRYNGTGNYNDKLYSMVIDDYGNVYLTGSSYGNGTDQDIVTIKYDTDGNELWGKRYNGPTSKYDFGVDLAIDKFGNVYIAGESVDTDNNTDYVTIKYSTDGILQWATRYKASNDTSAYPNAIDVDSMGNVYVTGFDFSSDYSDIITIKYDPNGIELWVDRYNGPANHEDAGADIMIDEQDNIYVGGYRDALFSWLTNWWVTSDSVLIKYAPDKTILWINSYTGDGIEMIGDIALDSSGNLFTTGDRTVKYDPNGVELWVNSDFPCPTGNIDIDLEGNAYVCGGIYTAFSEQDYITGKYSPDGTLLWTMQYNGPKNSIDFASGICTDDFGNVYVTGESFGIGTGADCTTVKYDAAGKQIWVKRYNGPVDSSDWGKIVKVDSLGNVYVGGSSLESTGFDYLVIKYHCNKPPVKTEAKLTPQALNRKSHRPNVIGMLKLMGFSRAYIDPNETMVLMPGDIEAERMDILPSNDSADSITLMGFFDNEALMNAIEQNGNIEVTIGIRLLSGQWVYGVDTVRIK